MQDNSRYEALERGGDFVRTTNDTHETAELQEFRNDIPGYCRPHTHVALVQNCQENGLSDQACGIL